MERWLQCWGSRDNQKCIGESKKVEYRRVQHRGVIAVGATRAPIEQVGGCRKGIRPERGREGSLEQEGADTIIDGTQNPFGTPVLLGCVGTC